MTDDVLRTYADSQEIRELPRAGKCIDGNLHKFDRREKCGRCQQRNPIGFAVPDYIWQAVRERAEKDALVPWEHEPLQTPFDILCLPCFVEIADWHGIEWDVDIVFWPVSRYTATVAEMEVAK